VGEEARAVFHALDQIRVQNPVMQNHRIRCPIESARLHNHCRNSHPQIRGGMADHSRLQSHGIHVIPKLCQVSHYQFSRINTDLSHHIFQGDTNFELRTLLDSGGSPSEQGEGLRHDQKNHGHTLGRRA
jgi:hypothetical protein